MKHLDLFSGIGGFALAVDAVWENAEHIFCDNDKFCQQVLKKHYPNAKIFGDIRKLTADSYWNGLQESGQELKTSGDRQLSEIDLLTGGFPCQPFSQAGRRKGTADSRHLWPEMLRVIHEFKPKWVIGENVAGLITWNDGLVFRQVLSDLETAGYEVQAFIIPAVAKNAPHRRDRVWIVANSENGRTDRDARKLSVEDEQKKEERPKKRNGESNDADWNDTDSERNGCQKRHSQAGRKEREGEQGRMCELARKDSFASNADTGRIQRYQRTSDEKETTSCDSWERNWLEVATRLCGMDARFSSWLDRYFNDVIYFDYETCNKDKKQALQILFKAIQSPKIREAIGGLWKVDDVEVLLQTMRQLQKRVGESERILLEGKSEQKGEMRVLPEYREIRCSSQGRKYNEQLARKLIDIVQELPYAIALEIVETGKILWLAFTSIYSQEVKLNGYELTKAGHRVQRLKALGNAIVPAVAIELMNMIKLVDENM